MVKDYTLKPCMKVIIPVGTLGDFRRARLGYFAKASLFTT
jgi:hypothetical protein